MKALISSCSSEIETESGNSLFTTDSSHLRYNVIQSGREAISGRNNKFTSHTYMLDANEQSYTSKGL